MTLPTFVEYHAGDLDLERWWNKLARTVAVDFDGVLHPYTDGWKGSVPVDEPPVPGAKEFLQWCVQQRYEVVVFSTRADHAEGLAGILAWLLKYGLLEYVEGGVTHTKPPAIAYVDDRAVPYAGDWEAVRQGVKVLTLGNSHGPAT
jgi:FMN phosphatase YigB (HAD superfamily)